jgi:hypothetical protein
LQTQNANNNLHEGNFAKPKIGNRQLTEASFIKPTLEGEGEAFSFISNTKECETIANHRKLMPQTESQEPSAHRSQLR